jgi:hypothetical protein
MGYPDLAVQPDMLLFISRKTGQGAPPFGVVQFTVSLPALLVLLASTRLIQRQKETQI